MSNKVTIDARNHRGMRSGNVSCYSGYYLVNGEEFDDEGNTSSDDTALISVLEKTLEILGIEDGDEMELLEIIQDVCGETNLDYDQIIVEITGTCENDLQAIKITDIDTSIDCLIRER